MTGPNVELASDFLVAGYYLVVDGEEVRPENGCGAWTTRSEALEAWEAMRSTWGTDGAA